MPTITQLQSPYLKGQSPYEIFQNRMDAVSGIANGIKKIRDNIYENSIIQSMIEDIDAYKDKNEIEESKNKLTSGYQDPQENEIWTFAEQVGDELIRQARGSMSQHEELMGIKQPKMTEHEAMMGITPDAQETLMARVETPETVTSEQEQVEQGVAVPKGSIDAILNQVQSMQGAIDFSKALEVMKNRPRTMGMTGMESNILQNIMNQPSQKEQYTSDIKMAKDIQDIMFPEQAQQREVNLYKKKLIAKAEVDKMFEQPETEGMTLEQEKALIDYYDEAGYVTTNIQRHSNGTVSFNLKPKGTETIGTQIDWDKAIKLGQSLGLEVSGMNIDDNTGMPKFTFARPRVSTISTEDGGKSLGTVDMRDFENNLRQTDNLEEMDSMIRQKELAGYDVSFAKNPEYKASLVYQQAQDDKKAIDVYQDFIAKGITKDEDGNSLVAQLQVAMENYNKRSQLYNAIKGEKLPELDSDIGIEEIPERNYDIRIGKWKGQVNTEKLAEMILAESQDWKEITIWLNSQDLTDEEKAEIIQEIHKRMK